MKNLSRNLLVLLCLLFLSTAVSAAPLSYGFSGNVLSIDNNLAAALGVSDDPSLVQLNAVVSMDTTTKNNYVFDNFGTLGNYSVDLSFSLGKLQSSKEIGAYNVITSSDFISIGSGEYTDTEGAFQATGFAIALQEINSPDFVLTNKLPLEPFNLDYFNQKNWLLQGVYNGNDVNIQGNILAMQKISNVSSPASILLVLLGGLILLLNNKFGLAAKSNALPELLMKA
ncbi:MAG: hypothetical protein R3240_13800 [Gammaproteobacteria bacterium]|nr:hypothetical protein [Gammaproteobacteria bacterium]